MSGQTIHGSREHVTWVVERGDESIVTGYGTRESDARADYERQASALIEGQSLRLERRVHVETWILHTDVIAETKKDPS